MCARVRVSERTSQYFYTVYIPVGFTYTHWSTDERWSDVFLLLRVLLSRDFAQFFVFLFFLSATVGLTVTP